MLFTAFLQERTAGGLGGAAGFVWNGQNRQFDLLSGDGFQTWDKGKKKKEKKKGFLTGTELIFYTSL